MGTLLLDIGDFFAAVFVIIAGGALFYVPALLLSFITGASVRLGSRIGHKVEAGTSLDKLLQKQPTGAVTKVDAPLETEISIMYEYYDGTFKPVSGDVFVVLNQGLKLIATPKGGIWISSDSKVAAVDIDNGSLRGINLGRATITYTVDRKYGHVPVEVRQHRRTSSMHRNSTGGDM